MHCASGLSNTCPGWSFMFKCTRSIEDQEEDPAMYYSTYLSQKLIYLWKHKGYEEEEVEEIRELESDEEVVVMKIEEEYEDEDDDFKELGELIPPKLGELFCRCCLPCGHMYGLSCINRWLLQSSSCGKCPQCNTVCSYKDKASSARYFPFTKQAYMKFKIYEQRRRRDARKLLPVTIERVLHVLQELQFLEDEYTNSMAQWNDVKKQLQELEQLVEKFGKPVDRLGQVDALKRQADALKRQADKLEQRGYALEPRASALERRLHALDKRISQFRPRLKFFAQMYKEHQLEIKKKTQLCTASPTCPKN